MPLIMHLFRNHLPDSSKAFPVPRPPNFAECANSGTFQTPELRLQTRAKDIVAGQEDPLLTRHMHGMHTHLYPMHW